MRTHLVTLSIFELLIIAKKTIQDIAQPYRNKKADTAVYSFKRPYKTVQYHTV